ncbi:hypothetical protein EDD15DRAFT_1571551 [Pisolithus albus]|nr:hypothetical protein EDD15DRAFT_1571551 [Pisolithus albus]
MPGREPTCSAELQLSHPNQLDSASVLNSTIVARLCHSAATFLPDGRAPVSGSDPGMDYPNVHDSGDGRTLGGQCNDVVTLYQGPFTTTYGSVMNGGHIIISRVFVFQERPYDRRSPMNC